MFRSMFNFDSKETSNMELKELIKGIKKFSNIITYMFHC
jgi:hypothetical protein